MLNTEARNEKTKHIDKFTSLEITKAMNVENMNTVNAVEEVLPDIARAIDAIAERLSRGGRLFYIGCGTSGRTGVIDAAECPPTFGISPDTIVGIIAGGYKSLVYPSETAEDNADAGIKDISVYSINENDTVVGISAAGGAAYVLSAIKYAGEHGALTIGITSNRGAPLSLIPDIAICPDTGAEVITGSTRLKAGTSQKLILNMLSTGAMIKTGKVRENLMVNVRPVNIKLKARVISIMCDLSGLDPESAEKKLEKYGWSIPAALDGE